MAKITINKAIEILNLLTTYQYSAQESDEGTAVKLGTQALERLLVGRNNPGMYWNDPLPGESPGGESP